ncbi:MAG: helix-turn-helix domain-containing protein [Okeania sp. SIO3I5]|nr:helix-turn-helix domain-containing protein [Okeania sp. SIO3I5]
MRISKFIIFMLLGFKTELHPNKEQKTILAKHAGNE